MIEEHDSFSGIISAVEAGTGVAIGAETLGYSFGNRVKFLHITPEPKPISVGIVGTKRPTQPSRGKILAVRQRSGTKREMKSARYLYVVYPGFLYSFFDD